MGQRTSDMILSVIWITVWIMWIQAASCQAARCVCVQDNSKTYRLTLIKFLEYV